MDDRFSGIVRLSDVSDFIEPSQKCIIPLEKNITKSDEIKLIYNNKNNEKAVVKESIKISLNDCLSCSGCITSAETVLVEEQSLPSLLDGIVGKKLSVITVSPQSVCSIAVKWGLAPSDTAILIAGFFLSKGATYVVDTSFGRLISLKFLSLEFNEHSSRPILSSACPGFVCYAEKKCGNLLTSLISRVRSPQAIHGALVKDYLARREQISVDEVFHASVMPCFDKKLEASRQDFLIPGTNIRETDCVISTGELEAVMTSNPLSDKIVLPSGWLGNFGRGHLIGIPGTSTSGGYGDYLIQQYLLKHSGEVRTTSIMKNLSVSEVISDDVVKLRIAKIYGFKNIQNYVRKIKAGKNTYDYIEIMACPNGCANGGGQIRVETLKSREDTLNTIEDLYNQLDFVCEDEVNSVLEDWKNLNENWRSFVYTDYHCIDSTRQNLQW